MRLDRLVMEKYPEQSRAQIQRWIEEGRVRVNNHVMTKISGKVDEWTTIEVDVPPARDTLVHSQDIPIDILFEDSEMVVVNKAAGMVVHPAHGNDDGTLVNALLHHCMDLSGIGGEKRPGIVHRLDKGTTGTIVIAKNDRSHQELSRQFKEREVKKEYLAIVCGVPTLNSGRINQPIARHPVDRKKMAVHATRGRVAVTEWCVKQRFKLHSFLHVMIGTGRTHQIRVHMASIGHPLAGDETYGGRRGQQQLAGISFNRPALHAWRLTLKHPTSNEQMTFESPIPEDMRDLLAALRKEI